MAKGNKVQAAVPATAYPTDVEMQAQGMTVLSARIRHLAAMGCKTGDIARIVLRSNGQHPVYQHVRNVLKTPLKRVEGAANAN